MKELLTALSAFQQECPTITKDTEGYGYKYASLPQIIEVINPLLAKHGLVFTQAFIKRYIDMPQQLVTTLFHLESGESIESAIVIPTVSLKGMNDYQSLGSGITYLRRYALSSLLGIVTDEDNDAAGEQEKKWITDKQMEQYIGKIQGGSYSDKTPDEFMKELRQDFKVNKKHEEILRYEFEFDKILEDGKE